MIDSEDLKDKIIDILDLANEIVEERKDMLQAVDRTGKRISIFAVAKLIQAELDR